MRKLTNDEFLNKLYSIHGDEYKPLEEYKGARTKINILHNKCNRTITIKPDDIYTGGCIHCGYESMKRKQRKTLAQFKQEVFDLVGDEYTVIGDYVNNRTPIMLEHTECGRRYTVHPADFLQGRRCGGCEVSNGEREVRRYLIREGYDFGEQLTFEGCKYKNRLRFDFGIIENEEVKCLIEYNGKQHYVPIDFYGGQEGFEERQLRDNIKIKYCLDNNIPLIIIRYDEDIEEVLDKLIPR